MGSTGNAGFLGDIQRGFDDCLFFALKELRFLFPLRASGCLYRL